MGGSTPSTQTTISKPFKEQKPFLVDLFNQAQQQFQAGGPSFFQGRTFAGQNSDDTRAQQVGRVGAQRAAGDLQVGSRANAQLANTNTGRNVFRQQNQDLEGYLDPNNNRFLQAHARGAVRPIFDELTERALPSIRSGAGGAGQAGSSRQALAEALSIGRASRNAGDVTSKIYSDAYTSGLEHVLDAGSARGGDILTGLGRSAALAPDIARARSVPASIYSGIGTQRRGFAQQGIDEQIARHNFQQQIAPAKLVDYANLIRGNYGGTGTSTLTGGGPSPIGSALGGGGLGALVAQLFPESVGAVGGTGAAVGGGALLGLLSGLV